MYRACPSMGQSTGSLTGQSVSSPCPLLGQALYLYYNDKFILCNEDKIRQDLFHLTTDHLSGCPDADFSGFQTTQTCIYNHVMWLIRKLLSNRWR